LHLDRAWPEAWEAEEYRLETLLDDHHLQAVEAMVETAVMMVTMNHLRMVAAMTDLLELLHPELMAEERRSVKRRRQRRQKQRRLPRRLPLSKNQPKPKLR
jgi:hypothetical protein